MARQQTVSCDAKDCTASEAAPNGRDLPVRWIRRVVTDAVRMPLVGVDGEVSGKVEFILCPEHGGALENPPLHPDVVAFINQPQEVG